MKRWPTKPLGEVCSVNPKLAASDAPAADAKVIFVPMAAVDEVSGTIARPENRRYSEVAKGYTPFRENDVLFAKITPCMQNGKAAVARDLRGGFGFGSTEFHVLRSAGSVLPRWVFAFIRQPAFRDAAEGSFTGSAGQQRVPSDFLKAFPIPVPPLAEQERIVKLLDEADELRKLRNQADRRTADLIPALFHEMFVESENKKNQWSRTSLASLCSKIVDCPHSTPIYAMSETPYKCVRSSDIQEGKLDWSSTKYVDELEYAKRVKLLVPRPGDVVFCREGARLGNAALLTDEKQVCLGQRMMLFRVEPAVATPEFLCAFLLNPVVQKVIWNLVGGSASPHLNVGHIKEFVVTLPPLPLQKEFAARVSEIRTLQAEQATSRHRLDDLFHSLLHRAFQGEL